MPSAGALGLTLVQAALVALPRERAAPAWFPRSPWWALLPAGSIVVVVFGIEAMPDSALALTWLALIACPPLAAAALAWLIRGTGPAWALAVVPLFLLAWLAPGGLPGEAAATAITAFSCVALGWLLVRAVPAPLLRWGIYAMAIVDAALIAADLLQGPSGVLGAAAPADLPRFQVLELGSARMGFGDAFVAATVGCLLAGDRSVQARAALLAATLGLAFDLLFLVLDTLPATVPIALALALVSRRSPPTRAEARPDLSCIGPMP